MGWEEGRVNLSYSYCHLGNIVARDKICSRDTKNVSGQHQKHFLYPLQVSQFSHPRRHVDRS